MILHRKKHQKRWEPIDYVLASADDILDKEKCPKCGTPAWFAFNDDNMIDFEDDTITCEACAFMDRTEKDAKDRDKEHGVTHFAKPKHAYEGIAGMEDEDMTLPGRREYQMRLLEKQVAMHSH